MGRDEQIRSGWRAPGETTPTGSVAVEAPGRQLIDSPTWRRIGSSLRLSPRELEVTQGVFDEATESQIADHLGISPRTVHMYVQRVYQKLDVHSHVALVLRVIKTRDSVGVGGRVPAARAGSSLSGSAAGPARQTRA